MWFPRLLAVLFVKEHEVKLAEAALPDPAKLVLIDTAPPRPVFVTLLLEKLQFTAVTVAPLAMVIPPPYFGPLPLFVELSEIHEPESERFAPEMYIPAPPSLDVFTLFDMVELVTVTNVVLSPEMYMPDPPWSVFVFPVIL